MGKTLFWYLFKDLVKIFLVAAVVLAGIMSFAGLLKPLVSNGLNVLQVAQMWLFLMPGMMTYSLPVAAVFAASMVYGRMSADNELTACRAAGISYRSICGPALALGIVSAICSLLFLCYVVPFCFYQAERVVYRNVAKVIVSEIQGARGYSSGHGKPTLFARDAYIPEDVGTEGEQVLVLREPVIVSYRDDTNIPSTFAMANKATLYIRQGEENEIEISGVLENATRFARDLGSSPEVGLGRSEFGPVSYPSPLRQDVKFMDITRLKQMAAAPESMQRVRRAMMRYIEQEQRQVLYNRIAEGIILTPTKGYVIDAGEQYQILAPRARVRGENGYFTIEPPPGEMVRLVIRRSAGRPVRIFDAASMRIKAELDNDYQMVAYTISMTDVLMPDGEEILRKSEYSEFCTTTMPEELRQLQHRKVADYLSENSPLPGKKADLMREQIVALNKVVAEMHSRASYAVSCLVLVMVGSVLGMQFRSGDFLSAFAVSVIPALLTITLVVAGNQTAGQVSYKTLENPIAMAIALIWLGNILAAILAAVLFLRIRRT